ncbi:uncharacterized protein TA18580 [Theileria annulata]|uniref:Uncharacterized protein n=1 Tax=Theileria annulata TaxID=5874 RepID=Q4UBH2_THEAN|nr:uncharacterized protein TA18580 [Theileria annulata]CAI75829.1 hypothetical protein TA18580 [Theileria annulata]|eukprot:XP_955305.1 hypothetical protein TA18580 [Theileria annulata]
MTDEEKCYENKFEGLESLQGGDAAVTYQLNDELNQHPVNSLPTSCRRVKLYEIGSTSDTWIDKGTGFCFFDGDLDSENPKLLVSLEHYGVKSLVSTYIKDNTDYSSQNGSDTRLYRAISFQNVVGHNACWYLLRCLVQKYISNFVDSINLQTTESKALAQASETNSEFRVLPVPTVNSILKLESNLESYNTISDGFYLDLYDKKWLKELFGVLNNCILSEDLATASAISSILVKLILKWCCSLELMHIFVSDDIFFNLLKAFECT